MTKHFFSSLFILSILLLSSSPFQVLCLENEANKLLIETDNADLIEPKDSTLSIHVSNVEGSTESNESKESAIYNTPLKTIQYFDPEGSNLTLELLEPGKITDIDFSDLALILRSPDLEKHYVAVFFDVGPFGCAFCPLFNFTIVEIAVRYPNITFFHVDVQVVASATLANWGVSDHPTTGYYLAGNRIGESTGLQGLLTIMNKITSLTKIKPTSDAIPHSADQALIDNSSSFCPSNIHWVTCIFGNATDYVWLFFPIAGSLLLLLLLAKFMQTWKITIERRHHVGVAAEGGARAVQQRR